MRLLVCGNRDWTDAGEIGYQLALIFGEDRERVVIHGNNGDLRARPPRGADVLAGWCAEGVGATVERWPVNHALDGPWPEAGPRRNKRMMKLSRPDRGLALGNLWKRDARMNVPGAPAPQWKGARSGGWRPTGTGHMVSLLLGANVPTRWVSAPDAPAIELVTMPQPPEVRR